MSLTEEICTISQDIHRKLVETRRKLHMQPELAFEEYRTAGFISDYLKQLGIEVKTGVGKTGVTGLIRGKGTGKTVALRADMDALPLAEENNCAYRSRTAGRMHACGHDVHMTCVLGAAEVLNMLRDRFTGNVKLLFQPAEEGGGGAFLMIDDGVLVNPRVDACIGAHVWPDVPAGKILVNYGNIFASMGNFEIVIKGKGGHGAMPQNTVDPIVAGCQAVGALQTIVGRKIDPLSPAVVSVCYFHSGTADNIIPDTATIKGTVRTFEKELGKRIPGLMRQILDGTTASAGAEYDMEFKELYPPTVNDRKVTDILHESAVKIIGGENVIISDRPSMVSEDFACYGEKVPSTYFRLGCRNETKGIVQPVHTSKFDADEDCILTGCRLFSQFAVDFLAQ